MGTLVGHVAPGFGFFVIGLWHLLNHIRLHALALHPKAYISLPWFPTPRIKYLELFLIMGGCLASISMELFIGPERHQPLAPDGTIPSNHLHNFEHSNISLTFLIYAQLLLFHLHSADHMGVEGQYHWLLQTVIFVSLSTTLLNIPFPHSFLTGFIRSASILLQGAWFIAMGFMLWTPELIPKGCFINSEEGHQVVRCRGPEDLERAKSLVNIQFSWYVIAVAVFAVAAYLALLKVYQEKVEYQSLGTKLDDETAIQIEDVEAQKRDKAESKRFLEMGKFFASSDMER
nr:transmembrane protein 45A-like [Ipomoea batatas]